MSSTDLILEWLPHFGTAEGAATSLPGVGPWGAAGISGVSAAGESIARDLANGEEVDWASATAHGLINGGAGRLSQGLTMPTSGKSLSVGPDFVDITRYPSYGPLLPNQAAISSARATANTLGREILNDTALGLVPD